MTSVKTGREMISHRRLGRQYQLRSKEWWKDLTTTETESWTSRSSNGDSTQFPKNIFSFAFLQIRFYHFLQVHGPKEKGGKERKPDWGRGSKAGFWFSKEGQLKCKCKEGKCKCDQDPDRGKEGVAVVLQIFCLLVKAQIKGRLTYALVCRSAVDNKLLLAFLLL